MKSIALVKYSLDVAEIRVDAATQEMRLRGVPERFGDIDKSVVEAAVRVKEVAGGTVHLLCFGPTAARTAVKDLLAMGADDATIVDDPFRGALEGALVARILETAIRRYGEFDLVFAGFASDDGYTHQTPGRLAERLGLPLVSYAHDVGVEEKGVRVVRELEDCLETVLIHLPAVISIGEQAVEGRRVTLLEAMKAQKKPLTLFSLDDLGFDVEALEHVRTMHELDRHGIVVQRKQQMLEGSSLESLADALIDQLVIDEILTEGAS